MDSYSAKIFALVATLLACGACASAFSCGDLDAAACKTKFTTEFTDDFKPLYLNAVQKFFTTFIDIGKAVSTELTENDLLKPQLDEAISKVSKDLESLNANTDDIKKISEIISQTMDDMGLKAMKGEKISTEYLQIAEKHNFKESLLTVLRDMQKDTANLWADKYAGLNSGDIDAYAAYTTVDGLMAQIRRPDIKKSKFTLLAMALNLLASEFRMEYLETVARLQFLLRKSFV